MIYRSDNVERVYGVYSIWQRPGTSIFKVHKACKGGQEHAL